MRVLLKLLLYAVVARFRSRATLEAELLALRHQLLVVHRRRQFRPRLTLIDRLIWILLYRVWPRCLYALVIVRPETVVRWHRTGFRTLWRWKCRSRGGRPRIEAGVRSLIREMSRDNPLWGAPRIHGELLKLGFDVAQSTVAKYMIRGMGPPSQSWGTFLRNHAPEIAAIDLFAVPTIDFRSLYVLLILRLDRRRLVWINVTPNPTAEWIARQITEAFPWDEAPGYLIRDRDRAYGTIFVQHLCAMGIRDSPHRTSVAVAERPCRASHRFNSSRMFGPHDRAQRISSASNSRRVCRILQRNPNTSCLGQGCA